MAFDLAGLLADPRLMDIGTGLLSQSGYSATPITFGQAMGGAMQFANQREADRVGLESARTTLAQQKQRQQAMTEIQGLLQPVNQPYSRVAPGTGPLAQPQSQMGVQSVVPAQTPEGQSKMLGLLSQVAPEAMTQGLLAQMFQQQDPARVSTDLATFRALFPAVAGTQDEAQRFSEWLPEFKAAQNTLSPTDAAQIAVANANLARINQEVSQSDTEFSRAEAGRVTDFNQILRDLAHFQKLNESLEGTFLEPGRVGMQQRRSAASLLGEYEKRFGKGSEEYERAVTAFDEAQTLQQGIVNRLGAVLGQGGLSRTDAGRSALAGEKPDISKTVDANRLVVNELAGYLTTLASDTGTYIDPSVLALFQQSDAPPPPPPLGPEAPSLLDRAGSAVSGAVDAATGAIPDEAAIDAEIDRLMMEIQQLRGR